MSLIESMERRMFLSAVAEGLPGAVDQTYPLFSESVKGLFDPFSQNTFGIYTAPFPAGGRSLVVEPDGRFLVADAFRSTLTVQRRNADGSADTTFGTAGVETISLQPPSSGGSGASATPTVSFVDVASLAVQADGKVVVALGASGLRTPSDATQFVIYRLDADGTPDTTFGSGGMVTTTIRGADVAEAVAVQPDGKIDVVGQNVVEGATISSDALEVARYLPDGSLDTTFGRGGTAVVTATNPVLGPVAADVSGDSIGLQGDGRILVPGTDGPHDHQSAVVLRLNPDGSLDPTFGKSGVAQTRLACNGDHPFLGLQPGGKFIISALNVIGTAPSDTNGFGGGPLAAQPPVVARLNADGTPDRTFGRGGKAVVRFAGPGGKFEGSTTALEPDGQILVAGYQSFGPPNPDQDDSILQRVYAGLARLTADGRPDRGFGHGGLVARFVRKSSLVPVQLLVAVDGNAAIVSDDGAPPLDFDYVHPNRLLLHHDPAIDLSGSRVILYGDSADETANVDTAPLPAQPGRTGLRVTINGTSEVFDASEVRSIRVVWLGHGRHDYRPSDFSGTVGLLSRGLGQLESPVTTLP